MVNIETFRKLALSFPEVTEQPHFEKISFRVGKKIFATYDPQKNLACLKLSELQQSIFSDIDRNLIYPVPNKWGKHGWTFITLSKVPLPVFKDVLREAYEEVRKGK